jgi:hypothetical protein
MLFPPAVGRIPGGRRLELVEHKIVGSVARGADEKSRIALPAECGESKTRPSRTRMNASRDLGNTITYRES